MARGLISLIFRVKIKVYRVVSYRYVSYRISLVQTEQARLISSLFYDQKYCECSLNICALSF